MENFAEGLNVELEEANRDTDLETAIAQSAEENRDTDLEMAITQSAEANRDPDLEMAIAQSAEANRDTDPDLETAIAQSAEYAEFMAIIEASESIESSTSTSTKECSLCTEIKPLSAFWTCDTCRCDTCCIACIRQSFEVSSTCPFCREEQAGKTVDDIVIEQRRPRCENIEADAEFARGLANQGPILVAPYIHNEMHNIYQDEFTDDEILTFIAAMSDL
jgi:hypothetical protein